MDIPRQASIYCLIGGSAFSHVGLLGDNSFCYNLSTDCGGFHIVTLPFELLRTLVPVDYGLLGLCYNQSDIYIYRNVLSFFLSFFFFGGGWGGRERDLSSPFFE